MQNKVRDIILVAVALGLLVGVLWPSSKGDSQSTDNKSKLSELSSGESADTATDGKEKGALTGKNGTRLSGPVLDVPHPLFPLVAGSVWEYMVTGPDELVPEELWTIKLESVPTMDTPGEALVGFGKNLKKAKFYFHGEGIQFDGMPLVEPSQLVGNMPTDVNGNFLPAMRYIIEGAVWSFMYDRQLPYRSTDRKGRTYMETAAAVQKDRAMVGEYQDVTTPLGTFKAYQVDWIGRISIDVKADKNARKVLRELTAAPYRDDSMWFAQGIGMVRRKVSFSGQTEDITFDIIRYYHPEL